MFKIIIVGGPCERYIRKCIDSILNQDEQDFEILVVLDPFDAACKVVESFHSTRIKMHRNSVKMGGSHNMFAATKLTDIKD